MKYPHNLKRRCLKAVFAALLLLTLTVTAGAFYESIYGLRGSTNIEINLLFDNLSGDAKKAYQDSLGGAGSLSDSEKTWGHIGNPYVINNVQHIRNLYYLQKMGFFENQFSDLKTPVGGTYDRDSIPYFLVCNRDGTPTAVDCGGMSIDPIGTDRHPFYGSIKGYGEGLSSVGTTTYSGSAIHNLVIHGSSADNIDVGLFNKIGCLGYPGPDTSASGTFNGVPSTLENLTFSDVQIQADGHSSHSSIHTWLVNLISGTDAVDVNETNHLGILAGHVEYAHIENISVYYSSSGAKAIQLNGGGGNFVCTTGFFGLMDNLNPEANQQTSTVVWNSGKNDGDFMYGAEGDGGLTPGIEVGYIRAKEIYEKFQGQPGMALIQMSDGTRPLTKTVSKFGNTNYYFYDGVFTFALSKGQKLNSPATLDTMDRLWPQPTETVSQFAAVSILAPGSLEAPPRAEHIPAESTEPAETTEPEAAIPGTTVPETTMPQVPETTAAAETGETEPAAPAAPIPVAIACSPENLTLQIWTLDENEERQYWLSVLEEENQKKAEKLAADQGITLEAALASLPEPILQKEREYRLLPGTYYFSAQAAGYVTLEEGILQVAEADPKQPDFAPQIIEITLEQQPPETTAGTEPADTQPQTEGTRPPETTTAAPETETIPAGTTAATTETVPPTTESAVAETAAAVIETIPSKASAMLSEIPVREQKASGIMLQESPKKAGAPKAAATAEFVCNPPELAKDIQIEVKKDGVLRDAAPGSPLIYPGLEKGSYTYTVNCLGYHSQSGKFQIKKNEATQGGTKQINLAELTEAEKPVIFECVPPDTEVTVTQNGGAVDASQGLLGGTYAYTASRPGYQTQEGPLEIPRVSGPVIQKIQLEALPVTVDFTPLSQQYPGLQIAMYQNGEKIPDAMTYSLKPGQYTYTASCEGYQTKHDIPLTVKAGQTPVLDLTLQKASTVTFEGLPGEAALAVTEGQTLCESLPDQPFQYRLPDGTYHYTVTCLGYADGTEGDFTVAGADQTISPILTETAKTVTFTCDPQDTVVVTDEAGTVQEATGENQFSLMHGVYTFTVSREGYLPVSDSLVVPAASGPIQKQISLQKAPEIPPVRVTFIPSLQPAPDGLTVTVMQGEKVLPSTAEDPLQYDLQPGEYSYTMTCQGYAPVSGSLSLAQNAQPVEELLQMLSVYKVSFHSDPRELAAKGLILEIRSGKAETWDSNPVICEISQAPYQQELADGVYSYQARCLGYQDGPVGEFTVNGISLARKIVLQEAPKSVTFLCDPQDLVLQLTDQNGKPVDPVNPPYGYALLSGTYHYTATREGYKTAENKILVVENVSGPVERQIRLARPVAVSFEPDPNQNPVPQDMKVVVIQGNREIQPITPGHYNLLPGNYRYKVTCPGFEDLENQPLTVEEEKPQNVLVKMAAFYMVRFEPVPPELADAGFQVEVRGGTPDQWDSSDAKLLLEKAPYECQLKAGSYSYQAVCPGYETGTVTSLTVAPGEAGAAISVKVELKKLCTVTFVGTFEPALPADNKTFAVQLRPAAGAQGETDIPTVQAPNDPGRITAELTEGKTYSCQASCYGYRNILPTQITVTGEPNQTVKLAFTQAQLQAVTVGWQLPKDHRSEKEITLMVTDPQGNEHTVSKEQTDPAKLEKYYSLYPGIYQYKAVPVSPYLETAVGSFVVEDREPASTEQSAQQVTITMIGHDANFPKHPGGIVRPPEIIHNSGYPDLVLSKKWTVDRSNGENVQYRMYLEEVQCAQDAADIQFVDGEVYFLAQDPNDSNVKMVSLWLNTPGSPNQPENIPLQNLGSARKVSNDKSQITITFASEEERQKAYESFGITFLKTGNQVSMLQGYTGNGAVRYTGLTSKEKGFFIHRDVPALEDLGTDGAAAVKNAAKWEIKPQHSDATGKYHWAFTRGRNNYFLNNNSGKLGMTTDHSGSETFRIYRVVKFDTTSAQPEYQPFQSTGPVANPTYRFKANEYVLKAKSDGNGGFLKNRYDLVSFADLGWRMKGGAEVSGKPDNPGLDQEIYTPDMYFNIKQVAQWGAGFNIIGLDLSNSGLIHVPIGSESANAGYIPTGTMAFNVNKAPTAKGEVVVRTLVKIPTPGAGDKNSEENNLGLWKGQNDGRNVDYILFSKNSPTNQHVPVPVSKPRDYPKTIPETQYGQEIPANGDFIQVDYEGETYYTCLQGETYLLAAEFDLYDTGLTWPEPPPPGQTGKTGITFLLAEQNRPLELVYCAADGVASATRDGTKGSSLGSIDFVYDDMAGNVIPVTQGAKKGTPETLDNYKTYYFPSNLLLHFNSLPRGADPSQLPQINQEILDVQRVIAGDANRPEIDLHVGRAGGWNDNNVQVLGGSGKSDFVKKEKR